MAHHGVKVLEKFVHCPGYGMSADYSFKKTGDRINVISWKMLLYPSVSSFKTFKFS
jgi:hypothetical protein